MDERSISPNEQSTDKNLDTSLRPTNWDGYFGQATVKQNVQILIEAARKRDEALDHVQAHASFGDGLDVVVQSPGFLRNVENVLAVGLAFEQRLRIRGYELLAVGGDRVF